jgi:hypothetical protein
MFERTGSLVSIGYRIGISPYPYTVEYDDDGSF